MILFEGQFNTAKVFTDYVEPSAEGIILSMLNQPFIAGSKIRIMPDVHAGKGCNIGTTMTIRDYVVPNMVGVDIGCGMRVIQLSEKRIDLPALDSYIHKNIPHGFAVHDRPHRSHGRVDLEDLRCYDKLDKRRMKESCGSLGGGNHFIEIDQDDVGNLYLVIHTGSRNPGKKVAEYYQKLAYELLGGKKLSEIPYELAYLTGSEMDSYLYDMQIMQAFAENNRRTIKEIILDGMKFHEVDEFESIHNYIDIDNMILRKGSCSAYTGQRLIIPMNMRDGSLICTGKGNEDWNFSAPHGAGRLFSRTEAKNRFSVSDFKKSMDGIYTTSVSADTLDECPMAYKPMNYILDQIQDTVTVDKIIKPIYNFKASENSRPSNRKT